MSTLGMFSTPKINPRALIDDIATALFVQRPNVDTPMYALLGAISAEESDLTQQKYSWFVQGFSVPSAALALAVPAVPSMSVSDITTTEPSIFIPSSIVVNERTGEYMRVVSLEGNSLKVVRGHGSIAPRAMQPGDTLTRVSLAVEEGSLRVLPRSTSFAEIDNITQTIRASWAVTGSAAAVRQRFSDAKANTMEACAQDYARDIETTLLFGERSSTMSGGQKLTTMDGLLSMIRKHAPENMSSLGSQVSLESLEAAFEPMFKWRSDDTYVNDRMVYTSMQGIKMLTALGRASGYVTLTPGQSSFGHKFTELITAVGSIKLVHHSMFDTYGVLKNSLLLVDPGSMRIRYLQGRKQIRTSVGENGLAPESGMDAQAGDLLSELTLAVHTPFTNGLVTFHPNWQIAKQEVVTMSGSYYIELTSPDECLVKEGPAHMLDPNTSVTVIATGAKPASVLTLVTPSGNAAATASAAGVATWTLNVGTAASYVAYLQVSADMTNTVITKSGVSFCIKQPCEQDPLTIDPCTP